MQNNENLPQQFEELKILAQPLVNYIRKRYDPHTTIIIDYDFAKVVREELGVPYPVDD